MKDLFKKDACLIVLEILLDGIVLKYLGMV